MAFDQEFWNFNIVELLFCPLYHACIQLDSKIANHVLQSMEEVVFFTFNTIFL